MKFDPLELGREIEIAYATDFIGDRNVLFTSILNRYGDISASLRTKLPSLVKMRGPYIQALPIPRWSNTEWDTFAESVRAIYAPNGLDKRVIALFARSIKELYAFQEKAINRILEDKNTLIVAGTGRGKTEAWLIPILHFILMAKRGKVLGHPSKSVKAILVYPTKALAQDQLKRLIKYLIELNKDLPENERVTVGIYDGDTPSLSDRDHMQYLVNAFKYFVCPIKDSERAHCRVCEESNNCSLVVRIGEKGIPELTVPLLQCGDKIPLDFIHLTRDDIEDAKVDILLTNPDIINFRLINVNADQERDVFIKEPKFVVIDEIHTLSGLFGSFVSTLMKRYLLVRKNLLVDKADDIRIIAASATISNKEEIFEKIVPSNEDFAVVEEEYEQIVKDFPLQIPDFLIDIDLTSENMLAETRKYLQGKPINEHMNSFLETLKLDDIDSTLFERDEGLKEYLGERVFERLTAQKDAPELDLIRAMHSELLKKARESDELSSLLKDHYKELGKDSVDRIVRNFFTIGELSGILENRIHLFCWPLDGYYSCINCGKIYNNPQGECEKCHHHFVSRIAACRICDEEVIESWFCSECLKLYTLSSNVEGKPTFFEIPTCNCTGEETPCVRVVWKPYFHCTGCGKTIKRNFIEVCEKCGSKMMFTEKGDHVVCINPTCTESRNPRPAQRCPYCKSELELLKNETLQCGNCGKAISVKENAVCECGTNMHPVLSLPWVCDNRNCAEVVSSQRPPIKCECGSKKFHLAGLFDFTQAYYCSDCHAYFASQSCGNSNHILELKPVNWQEYRLIDRNLKIEKATESRKAVPCYHARQRYNRKRYMPLVRSPENVAVTSAEHALRKIVNHAPLEQMRPFLRRAKILSFADSHGDMERLNRDFQEPEQEWFIDQLVVTVLEKGEKTLNDLYDSVTNEFDLRQKLYDRPKTIDLAKRLITNYQQRLRDKPALIKEEVDRRILGGYFYGRFESKRLVSSGIVDIRLAIPEGTSLDQDESVFLRLLYDNKTMDFKKLKEQLSAKLQNPLDNVLRRLEAKGFIIQDGARLRISPQSILCNLVSKDHPIAWDPVVDEFYPTIMNQFGEDLSSCVGFNKEYKERTDVFKPNFTKTGFRIDYSSPIMMISEAYKGTTNRTVRRELEYQFKNGIYPNFLSSGPAMELGVDIGDLDILCIYGTPPNINSYLQRIGRAGRATKKSLVYSVSKRNPIDYYYYQNPLELIQSKPQPVPLNEHNPEVIRISLTWALLDFIATKFWVPWRSENRPTGRCITDGEEIVKKEASATRPDDILLFTSIYYSKNVELEFGRRLAILQKIIKDNQIEARSWLETLLDYSYCPRCGRHYPSIYVGNCRTQGCAEIVIRAKDKFAELIEDALNSFDMHLVSFANDFQAALREQKRKLREEEDAAQDKLDSGVPVTEEEKQRLKLVVDSAEERQFQLRQLQKDVEQMPFAEFHKKTREKKYAFDIRTIEDEVDIIYFKEDPKTGHFSPEVEGRGIQMALKESHPYAVTTYARQKRVACRVAFDEWKRDEIINIFPDELICTTCFKRYQDLGKPKCDCGGDLKILQTQAPRRIEVYPDGYPLRENTELGRNSIRPLEIHAEADSGKQVKSTIPNIENKVTDFRPSHCWEITNNEGHKIGTLEYGEMSLATVVNSYYSIYEQGYIDHFPRYMELCDVDGCNSVVLQHGNHVCSRNSTHDPNTKKYVRLAYLFKTYGFRMAAEEKDSTVAHTFAHGLRLGLQNIAGVHIRNVGEVIDNEYSYVFDSETGGSGVTMLLTSIDEGEYKNFRHATDLFYKHLSTCKCDDGCPNCIFQFGCSEGNDPRKLSRKNAKRWMDNGVKIVERTIGQT